MTLQRQQMMIERPKKRHIRFKPDPLSLAYIDFNIESKSFNAAEVALIYNESYKGCALVLQIKEKLQKGAQVMIKLGKLRPMVAQVVWGRKLDEQLFLLGFEFLE